MGFRAPTLKEKYYIFNMAGIWDIVGSNVIGYDLKPEESHNFNLSAQYTTHGYVINGAAYYNIIRNRITTGMPYDKSAFPGDASLLGTTRWLPYVNVKRYNSLSLDLSLQKHWAQGISAMLAYAFIHEDDVKDADGNDMNGQYLPARPHSITANVDWDKQFSKNYGLNIALNGRFLSAVDNMEYVDYTTIDPATGKLLRTNVHYDAYTLWRLSVTQRICKAFKLSVTLDNIFNYNPTYHYFNSPFTNGTTIQAGLSIDLDML
jgi:outer membrane receptor for ferrienterochelin and colicins